MAPVTSHAARNVRIEALRLVAIVCIAVFHTFQPWFAAATSGAWDPGAVVLWKLGCISLLGAFGNHVFFLISGYFLIPSVAHSWRVRDGRGGYWRAQAAKTARRIMTILASVALWAAATLAVSAWVVPVPGVGEGSVSWLVGGLEFIWVYAALVIATPAIGRVWARLRRPGAAVAVLTVLVLGVSAYIAFFSPGSAERGLLEWRKLMSAASYLAAFLVGGSVRACGNGGAECKGPAGAADGAGDDGVGAAGRGASAGIARWAGSPWPLAAAVGVSLAIEGVAAWTNDAWLLTALSYKSTSALSFACAVAALLAVAGDGGAPADRPASRATRAVLWLTPSILGYYLAQSMFSGLWRPVMDACCRQVLAGGGTYALLLFGTLASVVLLVMVLVFDRLTRVGVLRLLHLR